MEGKSLTNKNRIPIILDLIESHWVEHPDLSLGELIYKLSEEAHYGLFSLKDDTLLKDLEDFKKVI